MGFIARSQVKLAEDRGHMTLDRTLAEVELPGDAEVGVAFGHQAEHFPLPVGQLGQRIVLLAVPEQLGNDFRIEGRATLGTRRTVSRKRSMSTTRSLSR